MDKQTITFKDDGSVEVSVIPANPEPVIQYKGSIDALETEIMHLRSQADNFSKQAANINAQADGKQTLLDQINAAKPAVVPDAQPVVL